MYQAAQDYVIMVRMEIAQWPVDSKYKEFKEQSQHRKGMIDFANITSDS